MLFSSILFIFYFLPILLLSWWFIRDKVKLANLLLLVASLVFYAWGEPVFVLIMVASILMNFTIGKLIANTLFTKLYLILGVCFNLSVLVYFKYIRFLVENLANAFALDVNIPETALPLGISFFTFQAITYLVDLYRKEITVQNNILNLALYISLFPQLIAGPIVRYSTIEKQISSRTVSVDDFYQGVRRFIIGFSKKMLIANPFGEVADSIFVMEDNLSSYLVAVAIIAYTIQIYFDFSAYSDMAIGLGRMFGFKFLENFNYPYIATSIQEFWRRWHISLSSFLRDYLYIPLGGNRKGTMRTYINLVTVFLLCGLWHGAAWTFLIWGGYFGLFLIIERAFLGKILQKLPKAISWVYTIVIIMVSWLIFRAENMVQALDMFSILFEGSKNHLHKQYTKDIYLLVALGGAVLGSTPLFRNYILKAKNVYIRLGGDVLLLLFFTTAISFLAVGTYNPFIYFRF